MIGTRMTAALVAVAGITALASGAHAATGTVTGTIKHWQKQGGYCPASRNCVGAKYRENQFDSAQPVEQTKVYVRNSSNDAVIGQGVTNESGNFTIQWTATPMPAQAYITWHAEHSDNRFVVRGASGGAWTFYSNPFGLVSSGTVNRGAMQWGTREAPHDVTNVFDGAQKMWWDSLWFSPRMRSFFSNVEIRFSSDECPTSCARGKDNLIIMDPASAYSPQGRIMHEMGHIASYRSHKGQEYWQRGVYDYPCPTCDDGWNFYSPEWHRSSFEEGFATFLADVAFYGSSAPEPYTCLSGQGPCFESPELSAGTTCNVAAQEGRWALSVMRVLRDVYDSVADCAPGGHCDAVSSAYSQFADTMFEFPDGRCNGCENEGWACFIIESKDLCWIENADGRSIYDFAGHYQAKYGVNLSSVLAMNCL